MNKAKLTEKDFESMPSVELSQEEWCLTLALVLSGKSLNEIRAILQNNWEKRYEEWKKQKGYS